METILVSIDGGMDKENVALYMQWNIIRPLKRKSWYLQQHE